MVGMEEDIAQGDPPDRDRDRQRRQGLRGHLTIGV
jgi:hypothetical protein